jgi:hypothetical protein
VLVALGVPSGALGHGDPTAHYLETDALLTSYSSPPDLRVERRLRGVLDAAAARGYPIKVALIVNEGDTGGEPEPLADTQTYVATVSAQLESVKALAAPVLIVTPHGYGLGGRQPRDGRLTSITPPLAASLTRDLPLAGKEEGTALARTAMVAVRQLAAAGGHPLPKHIPPAKDDLNGILRGAPSQDGGPWLIAALALATLLLGALLVATHRRVMRLTATSTRAWAGGPTARRPDRRTRPRRP